MKTKSINILMVDDHSLILKGYMEVLKSFQDRGGEYIFQIEQASSLNQAQEIIKTTYANRMLDLVVLDIGLPGAGSPVGTSGLDLGILLRKSHGHAKIIVITGYDTYPLIHRLMETLKPEGLLLKSELDPQGLYTAFEDVLQGSSYYTKTVRRFLVEGHTRTPILDDYDILILYHLSEGKLTKELPNHLPLSQRSIERRKSRMKEIMDLEQHSSDVLLLNRAKEMGYLGG